MLDAALMSVLKFLEVWDFYSLEVPKVVCTIGLVSQASVDLFIVDRLEKGKSLLGDQLSVYLILLTCLAAVLRSFAYFLGDK